MTIRDVAALAQVSVGTASRVLSGSPATSAAARERVTAAARRLGYRPNAQARSLRSTRTHTIGLLVSDVRNPFFADVAHAAEQAALAAGYVTLLANANEDTRQQDTYLETFLFQRVDGVIAAPQGAGGGDLASLVERGVPLVFVDRTVEGFEVPSVTADNDSGTREAVAHLARRGHTRIGYIGGPTSISTGRLRADAFVRAIAEHGLDPDPALIAHGDFMSASGGRCADALMSVPRPPTALLIADSPMAIGALTALRRRRVRIGTDVDLVAFDDVEWLSELDPPLSVVAQDAAAMGRAAVRLLFDVIGGRTPESVVLPTRLIVRRSSSGAAPEPAPEPVPAQGPAPAAPAPAPAPKPPSPSKGRP
ncbi:LacI family DNA-binding transcriptional regulator [Allonocardiopsis opalescens]|uniref:LacI family DNA-binding transcriptional regulator n=1 Tax=Allonocardiopsis opalescens TaxID=1144618 RepID=UPI001B8078D6|nr:LacI family DNA-binding transcriptional regulator [Allonocardiopsis opalescens]